MKIDEIKRLIEAMLFAYGKEIDPREIARITEINLGDIINIIEDMQVEYKEQNRGIEIIKVNDGYQLATKKEFYEYICLLFDSRNKPNLSNPALEALSIIAYNPKITKPEIEQIRGVNSDGVIYKLLEYGLIEEAGKIDAPGRPMGYKTTNQFLRLFGLESLEQLPELPKYKLDENEQIVLDDFEEINVDIDNEENNM